MNYTCPYCKHHSTLNNSDSQTNWTGLYLNKPNIGPVGIRIAAITCPNKDCQKLKLKAWLTGQNSAGREIESKVIQTWNLLPESNAIILPDYVPKPIIEDYYEACRIRDLSPKASATLSRRCLQGMIRDFHKVVKNTLNEEINALENIIDHDTWNSIDAIRSIGNIGAHMEKDINTIIEVDPEEAQILIEMIEQLVDDWYIAKEHKKIRNQKILTIAKEKTEQKKSKTSQP